MENKITSGIFGPYLMAESRGEHGNQAQATSSVFLTLAHVKWDILLPL